MTEVAARAGVTRLVLYRHFDSKEELYRAALSIVVERLRTEFEGLERSQITATMVRIAREHPDGYRLLWRHARHEPLFAVEAEVFQLMSASYADGIVGTYISDRTVSAWAATAVVDHLHEGICAWLDRGDPERDDEFAELLRAGTRAMVTAWAAQPNGMNQN